MSTSLMISPPSARREKEYRAGPCLYVLTPYRYSSRFATTDTAFRSSPSFSYTS